LISWSRCLQNYFYILLFALLEEAVLEAVLVVGALRLVEVVHVQLTDEGREVVVLEELRQDLL